MRSLMPLAIVLTLGCAGRAPSDPASDPAAPDVPAAERVPDGIAIGDDEPVPELLELCASGDDCASGACARAGGFDHRAGSCSVPCASHDDCTEAGFAACTIAGGCASGCTTSDDCGAHAVCVEGAFNASPPGVCQPLVWARCDGQVDCDALTAAGSAPSNCVERLEYDGFVSLCQPVDAPSIWGLLPGGAPCNPISHGALPAAERCATGVCGDGDRCTSPCVDDDDCPADMVCEGRSIHINNDSGPAALDFDVINGQCRHFSGSQVECASDVDCGTEESCSWRWMPDASMRTQCRSADPGDLARGEACTANTACASGLCVDGACTTTCGTSNDCAAGARCLLSPLDGDDAVPLCRTGAPCTAERDCEVPGETCIPTLDGDTAIGRCAPSVYGEVPMGESCSLASYLTSDPSPADVCMLSCTADGFCTSLCDEDADCAAGGDHMVCGVVRTAMFSGLALNAQRDVAVGTCFAAEGTRASCRRDADCTAVDELCRAFWTHDGAFDPRCSKPATPTAVIGGDCFGPDACASGFCDTIEQDLSALARCTSFCVDDNDCGAGAACQPARADVSWLFGANLYGEALSSDAVQLDDDVRVCRRTF